MAKGAVSAIKTGCELYNEFKGTLVEAKEAVDEVAAIGREVSGVWGKLTGFFSGKQEQAVSKPQAKAKAKKFKEFDELQVKKDITDQLITFFRYYEQLKDYAAEQEARIYSETENSAPMMEQALYMVMARDEMEKLQVEIRETMIYGVSGMKDLYTRVIAQVGVIAEQQELSRIKKMQDEKRAAWQRRAAKDKAWDITLMLVGLAIVGGYIALMMWVIVQDRQIRLGF